MTSLECSTCCGNWRGRVGPESYPGRAQVTAQPRSGSRCWQLGLGVRLVSVTLVFARGVVRDSLPALDIYESVCG